MKLLEWIGIGEGEWVYLNEVRKGTSQGVC